MEKREQTSEGYLANFEASHLATQAGPGVIYLHLRREIEAEQIAGRPVRCMFIELELELELGQAVRHWHNLGELIRCAGALEQRR